MRNPEGIFLTDNLESLKNFNKSQYKLGIVERNALTGGDEFFNELMKKPFQVSGAVRKLFAKSDIVKLLENTLSPELRANEFFKQWLSDMEDVCKSFCELENIKDVAFWLGTKRGCSRYHVDNVPKRLLVTYAGRGTEWIPDMAADRTAFESGEPNEHIVKDTSALRHIRQWDVAVFRGFREGILHRTPDEALNGPSILLRLDHSSFLKKIDHSY